MTAGTALRSKSALPVLARPLQLSSEKTAIETVQLILSENWAQFTLNLAGMDQKTNGPEILHQARVGWRRFNSTRQFFKPLLPDLSQLPKEPLHALWVLLGQVRDMDVALELTLPAWRDLYVDGDPERRVYWNAMVQTLCMRREQARLTLSHACRQPDVQIHLQSVSHWIDSLHRMSCPASAQLCGPDFQGWIERRLERLSRKLAKWSHKDQQKGQHKARIFAKQLRYEVEILQSILPGKWGDRHLKKAKKLQADIGWQRDRETACKLVNSLKRYPAIAAFIQTQPLA